MTPAQFQLNGRVALVTGCGSGLGAAIARALAEAGADIVGLHRGSVDQTRTDVETRGRVFYPLQADLAALSADAIAGVVADAVAAAGHVDILVNNAGTISRQPALEVSEDAWHEVLQTNLTAAFFLSQAVARHLLAGPQPENPKSRGRIINIASMLSFQGGVNVAAYTASKSGLVGLTRLLVNEWASLGINVNAIAPGYFDTNATAALQADNVRSKAILDRIPAGRWGQPDDLAGAVIFLASAAANYVHGAIVPVDGGWLAR